MRSQHGPRLTVEKDSVGLVKGFDIYIGSGASPGSRDKILGELRSRRIIVGGRPR